MNPDKFAFNGTYGPNWDTVREEIRERDDYKCQNCGVSEEKHIQDAGSVLPVHHIIARARFGRDYETANHESNLITLCISCHPEYNHLPVDTQCAQLDLPRPSVSPLPTDISHDHNSPEYWIAEANKNVPTQDSDFKPIDYYQYTCRRCIAGAPTLVDIFETSTWAEIAATAGITGETSNAEAVDESLSIIQNTAKSVDGSLTQSKYNEQKPLTAPSTDEIVDLFGSWEYTKLLAGVVDQISDNELDSLSAPISSHTAEDCIQAIQYTDAQIEGGLTEQIYNGINRFHDPGRSAIVRHFGTWTAAREAAGVERRSRIQWEEEELMDILQDVSKRTDEPLTRKQYNKLSSKDQPCAFSFEDRFGGWIAALQTAEVDHELPTGYWDKQMIKQKLRDAVEYIEGTITHNSYGELSGTYPSIKTIVDRFGSFGNALETIGIEPQPATQQQYSKEDYAQSLRVTANKSSADYLTIFEYETYKLDSMPGHGAIANHFGDWPSALESIGLDVSEMPYEPVRHEIDTDEITQTTPPTQPYTEEDCINSLKEFVDQAIRAPSDSEYDSAGFKPRSRTIYRIVGSWEIAKEQAGIQTGIASPDHIISAIQEVHGFTGYEPTMDDYRNYRREQNPELPPASAVTRVFESWNYAKKSADIPVTNHPQYTKEIATDALEYVVDKLGKTPTRKEYSESRRPHDPSPNTVIGYWNDSWVETLQAHDLELLPSQHNSWTKDECIEFLQKAENKLGESPTITQYRDCVGSNAPSESTLNDLFGGFNDAKRDADLEVGKGHDVSEEDCRRSLYRVVRELNKIPTQKEYDTTKADSAPSVGSVKKYLAEGSWTELKNSLNLAEIVAEEETEPQSEITEFASD